MAGEFGSDGTEGAATHGVRLNLLLCSQCPRVFLLFWLLAPMSIVPEGFHRIIPQAPSIVDERIARHQLRRELTYEVDRRQAFKAYCVWYRATARQHQQELARWRGCSVEDLRHVTPRSPHAKPTGRTRSPLRQMWGWAHSWWLRYIHN